MTAEWNDADPLPTDVPTLHALVRDLRRELAATRAELAEVKGKLDRLLAVTFRRSERAKRPRTPPPDADRPPRPRHRHGRSPLPDHLERRIDVRDLTAEQKRCPCCGHERARIGEQTAEQLDCDPVRYFVRRTIRISYACHRCDPTTVPADERVTTAGPGTVGPIAKGLCGPGLLPELHALGDHPTDEQLTPLLPDRWLASRPNTSATAA